MTDRRLNVLFLCTGNSARSILAEAILDRAGQGRFNAFSAGSQPAGQVNPFAIELLAALNYDTSKFRSKSWDEFEAEGAPPMDFVFTVCDNAAAETCPVWPGAPMRAHWGVPDPAAAQGTDADIREAFSMAYEMLESRITAFISLPAKELTHSTVQAALDRIGQGRPNKPAKD